MSVIPSEIPCSYNYNIIRLVAQGFVCTFKNPDNFDATFKKGDTEVDVQYACLFVYARKTTETDIVKLLGFPPDNYSLYVEDPDGNPVKMLMASMNMVGIHPLFKVKENGYMIFDRNGKSACMVLNDQIILKTQPSPEIDVFLVAYFSDMPRTIIA